MAVFTRLEHNVLTRWIGRYPIGGLLHFEGIRSGIENSNYFVTTTRGRFVLTLFERLTHAELPFHLDLMRHLAARGIPCPDPVADLDGAVLATLAGKPAALCTWLDGGAVDAPAAHHCAQLGETIARMHLAAAEFPGQAPNPRGLDWQLSVAPDLLKRLEPEPARLLADELQQQRAFAASTSALPASAVHADLFRDNVFFAGQAPEPPLCGVIDFWFAGVDYWLFDLAVAANDWCLSPTERPRTDHCDHVDGFDARRLDALMAAYRRVRPLDDAECAAWPMMLRAAALRFWISRLFDRYFPRPAEIVAPKDPAHFEHLLRRHRAVAAVLR